MNKFTSTNPDNKSVYQRAKDLVKYVHDLFPDGNVKGSYWEDELSYDASLELLRLQKALAKSVPLTDYADWQVKCVHCGKITPINYNNDDNFAQYHKPDCIWVLAKIYTLGDK